MSYMKMKSLNSEAGDDPTAAVALEKEANHTVWRQWHRRSHSLAGAAAGVGLTGIVATKIGFVAPASAEVINTTEIVEIMTSMTTIFPSMGSMVIAIVPTLLILAVVGFLLGFFDSILDAINGCMKGFGR